MGYRRALSAFLGTLLFAGTLFSATLARADDTMAAPETADSRRAEINPLISPPETCKEHVRPNRLFFFDETASFYWKGIHHDRFSGRLAGLESKEGYYNVSIPAISAIATGLSSFFGVCDDWWSGDFSIIFGLGQQVRMSGAAGWDVEMSFITWAPRLEFRYCTEKKEDDSFFCGAFRHSHISGGSGDLVNETTNTLLTYFNENRIRNNVDELNLVSLRFMFSKTLFDGRLLLQGDVANNLFQTSFDHFIELSLFNKTNQNQNGAYPYPWSMNARAALHLTHLVDASISLTTELAKHERPYLVEPAIEMYLNRDRLVSFRIYYDQYGGMKDNSLNTTQWGIWSNAEGNGFALVAQVSF